MLLMMSSISSEVEEIGRVWLGEMTRGGGSVYGLDYAAAKLEPGGWR